MVKNGAKDIIKGNKIQCTKHTVDTVDPILSKLIFTFIYNTGILVLI